MSLARSLIRIIDSYTNRCGHTLAWLCLTMTVVTCLLVVLRYGFGIGSVAAQESVTYMHAALFMGAAAFTLQKDRHVRVDILYRNFSPRSQAWVNSVGGIVFLMPLCIFVIAVSWQFVADAWTVKEASAEPGGIPAIFLLKTLIPVMGLNLLLQGIAEILRSTLVLLGEDVTSEGKV